jgi:uncharacterized hydrophobic protein (TIGR00271 family)
MTDLARAYHRWVAHWISASDRTAIFQDAASTATNAGLAYWLVLALAGAIAALGLALDSSAVIIGAMLIAPLLGPVVGLALALAIGDGRLAVEIALLVFLSTCGVIIIGALLAVALPVPFQTVTAEIAARTRPTTLDLVIAVFSGLAGAVVTVAPRSRLSGAVPGVAVAVALVPPLAVTGYGIGTGWNWPIIRGSLLLYGANLAGIVLSGMTVFLIVGMPHAEVLRTVEAWHRTHPPNPFTNWIERIPGLRSLGIMRSALARVTLVVAFAALVALPLRETLKQIARETRVQHAVDGATQLFTKPGHSFVINRDVELASKGTRVVLNVATTGWFGDSVRAEFERRASAAAGEPVTLVLDQLPASGGDLSNLANLLSTTRPPTSPTPPSTTPSPVSSLIALRGAVSDAIKSLTLPDSLTIIGFDLGIADSTLGTALRLVYAAPSPLESQTAQILRRQLAQALALPQLVVSGSFVSTAERSLRLRDRSAIDSLALLMQRHPRLRIELISGVGSRRAELDSIAALLRGESGADSSRVTRTVSATRRGIAGRLLLH